MNRSEILSRSPWLRASDGTASAIKTSNVRKRTQAAPFSIALRVGGGGEIIAFGGRGGKLAVVGAPGTHDAYSSGVTTYQRGRWSKKISRFEPRTESPTPCWCGPTRATRFRLSSI